MIVFRSASCQRPVHLSEETRRFAFDSLNGKYGQEIRKSDHLLLKREEYKGLSRYRLYDLLVSMIVREAPIRVIHGEMLAGSATLKAASRHMLPVFNEDGEWIIGGGSHTTLGFDRVLREGIDSYETRIRARQQQPCTDEEKEFLSSLLNTIASMRVWHGRYMAAIEDEAEEQSQEKYGEEENYGDDPQARIEEELETMGPVRAAFAKLGVAHSLVRGLQRVDSGDARRNALQFAFVRGAEHRRDRAFHPLGNRTKKIAYSV